MRQFDGLEFCQFLAGDAAAARLVTTWEDRGRFEAARGRFESWIKEEDAAAAYQSSVLQGQLRLKPRSTWWKPASFWLVFVHVVAFFGGLEVIENRLDHFFAQPEAAPADATDHYDCLVREPFHREMRLRNIALRGVSHFRINEINFEPVSPGVNGSQRRAALVFPHIKPGDEVVVPIDGLLDTAGEYRAAVQVVVESGRWVDPVALRFERPLYVWKAWSFSAPTIKSKEREARLEMRLDVGASYPRGLAGDIVLKQSGDVTISHVESTGLRTWDDPRHNPEPGKETSSITWYTGAVGPMQRIPFVVVLKAKGAKTEEEWNELLGRVEAGASEFIEKTEK